MALGFDYSSSGRRLDDHAREELRARAADIAQSLLGEPNRRLSNRRELRWGRKGSFALIVEGDKRGLWRDHENEVGGDIIKLIARERGCSIGEAIAYAMDSYVGPSQSGGSTTARRVEPEQDDAERIDRAVDIWSEVQPLCGTLGEMYLNNRGIDVPDEALSVLGLHRHCPFAGRRAPALVALVEDIITGEPIAVHRRELTQEATAAGTAKALGPVGGGAIRLARPVNGELAIGEGIETCLSGMQLGYGPAWSVISAGGVKNFPVLDYVARLTILVDHDEAGQGAAAECRARWVAAGKAVRCAMPEEPGKDFNDVLLAELAKQHA
jgi:putative DNA primase/helicase